MIRVDDKLKFEYLINRGLLPSLSDSSGCNALIYAIRMEKLEFVAFMLEGDYNAYDCPGD